MIPQLMKGKNKNRKIVNPTLLNNQVKKSNKKYCIRQKENMKKRLKIIAITPVLINPFL